jgi:LemA protein
MSWILVVVAVVLVLGLYAWYATIVTRRNRVAEALAGIDTQLQQRHDLIPNILTIARRFLEHEATLLTEISSLRAKATAQLGERDFSRIEDKFRTEEQLGASLGRFIAVAENYPALTSSGPMMQAQHSYMEVETNISAARRFYNAAVGDLRNAVQIFPGSLVAGLAGVRDLPPFFETSEVARTPVDAGKYL